jgi:hypothetical protein
VHAAIYDAVNGIQHQYRPYFVTERAPRGGSAEAAVAQAAYTALVGLYPAQKPALDTDLANSLATIPGYPASHHVVLGQAWGEYVAEQILAWRSTDGATTPLPPYYGGGRPGDLAFASGRQQRGWHAAGALSAICGPGPFRNDQPRPVSARAAARFDQRLVRRRRQ